MIFKKNYIATCRFVLILLIAGCNNLPDEEQGSVSSPNDAPEKAILLPQSQTYYKQGDTLSISLQLRNNYQPDSVHISVDDKPITNSKLGLSAKLPTTGEKLGKHTLVATMFSKGKVENITNVIYLRAAKPPKIYDYSVVNVYPHDVTAFTEGLEYVDGYLYESTGQYGQSELRKVELSTGRVLKKIALGNQYFGEGLTKFKNNFIQLTWRENTGFVYDLDFNLIKTFDLNTTEGWGLTNDGTNLLKSDGTHKITYLNPETFKEEKYIEVYDHQLPVRRINELEYVNGNIFANIWETNSIVIINPATGELIATVNVADILNMYEKPRNIDVLNGIAYDAKNKRLFITGKNWPKLFEIKVTAK